jgi:hypothetical protein
MHIVYPATTWIPWIVPPFTVERVSLHMERIFSTEVPERIP